MHGSFNAESHGESHQPSVIFKDILDLDCQHEFLKSLANYILNSKICTKCQGACIPIRGRNAGRNGVKLDSAATIFTFYAPWKKGAPSHKVPGGLHSHSRPTALFFSQWALPNGAPTASQRRQNGVKSPPRTH